MWERKRGTSSGGWAGYALAFAAGAAATLAGSLLGWWG
jgi:hypothetical protein